MESNYLIKRTYAVGYSDSCEELNRKMIQDILNIKLLLDNNQSLKKISTKEVHKTHTADNEINNIKKI